MKRTHIGGQAVMEGVMMRGKKEYTVAVRKPDGQIEMMKKPTSSLLNQYKFLRIPILRGIIAFIESLQIGFTTLNYSASFFEEEEKPSKFEIWLQEKFGDRLNDFIMSITMIIGVGLGIALFILLPNLITSVFIKVQRNPFVYNIVEGLMRISIFLAYLLGVSRIKDIYRVFQYHGAEHKVISCYEHGKELTVENVKQHGRLHPRCGTSFLFVVMIISILVFSLIPRYDVIWMQMLSRLLLVPIVAGISYEFIKLAGTYDNSVLGVLSYPGMALQKITTKEPDEDQIEVAITAMKGVLENEENL